MVADPDKRPSTLVLDAWGGPPGKVFAQVVNTDPGVDQASACAAPLNDGACRLTACTVGGIGLPARGYGDFGSISASVGAATETLTYNEFGYVPDYFPEQVTLGTGGIMTFHGGNAMGVPEFSVSATIPALAVLSSPSPTADGAAVLIDTSKDLSVSWSPISIGQIRFHLNSVKDQVGGTALALECTFEGAAGAGVVSHTLLSSLKKELSPTASIDAGLDSKLETTTVVDGLTITTLGHQQAATPSHDFSVTLE